MIRTSCCTSIAPIAPYRAGAQLIAASQATLALTEDRDYEPDPEREDEGVVEALSVPGGLGEQARTVAGRIIPSLHVDEGIAYHEIAALYPAEKHFCGLLLAALDDAQIPYVFERDARFPDQPVVRWLKRCACRALEQRGPEVERFGSLLGPYREYVRDARLLDATLELELRARLSRALAAVEDPGFPSRRGSSARWESWASARFSNGPAGVQRTSRR